jgi:ribonuclease HI
MIVWGGGPIVFQKCKTEGGSFNLLMDVCLNRLSKEDFELMAVICRRIWLRRNKMVFDQIFTPPGVVYEEAVRSLEDFRLCNSIEGQESTHRGGVAAPVPVACWQAPPCGKIKINWDASLNKGMDIIGIGVVVRDSSENFLGGWCISKQLRVDPLMAEAMAAMEAVIFSREASFFYAIFEGDSLQIVKAINASSPNLSKIGHFIESIQSEMRYYRSASFVRVSKEFNSVAHALAKEASCSLRDSVWLEEVPNFIAVLREQLHP